MPRLSYSLVCGPMFAGKTSELIDAFSQARRRGDAVIILAPGMDTRHSGTSVVSHAGAMAGPVFRITDPDNLASALSRLPRRQSSMILIDECQFFDVGFSGDFLESIMFSLADRDSDIHLAFYGLDLDAVQRPWPMTDRIRLLPGIRVSTLTARCRSCGAPASYTDRHMAGNTVEVGGSETYFPSCGDHHTLRCAEAAPEPLLGKVA